MSKKNVYNVEPLRSAEEIEEMKWAIKRGSKSSPKNKFLAERDVLLFLVGINTGLRINDLVSLKIRDVRNDFFFIREGKTQKKREINLTMLRQEIDSFIQGKDPDEYLFKSQQGIKHITITQAYRILNDAGEFLGRNDMGTHSMRKTFGYHHYKKFKDVAILQEIFNHGSPTITRAYIGIRQDEINESLVDFRLG